MFTGLTEDWVEHAILKRVQIASPLGQGFSFMDPPTPPLFPNPVHGSFYLDEGFPLSCASPFPHLC